MNIYQNFCVKIKSHGDDLMEFLRLHDEMVDGHYDVNVHHDLQDELSEIASNYETKSGLVVRRESDAWYLEDDCGEPSWDVLTPLVQIWMRRCNITKPVVITYANIADKHAAGVFGGGTIWIWQDDDCVIDSHSLAQTKYLKQLREIIENG